MSKRLSTALRRIIHGQYSIADLARKAGKSYVTIHTMFRNGTLPRPDVGEEGKHKFYSQSLYEECLKIIATPKLTITELAKKAKVRQQLVQQWIASGALMGPDVVFGRVRYYSPELFKRMLAAIKQAKAE